MTENKENKDKMKDSDLSLMQFLSGNILTSEIIKKNIWYILFVVFLSVVYINNKYRTEDLLLNIIRLQNEVKEMRDRSVSFAAELMSLSRESEVIKIVSEKSMNLQELKMPPDKIEIKSNTDTDKNCRLVTEKIIDKAIINSIKILIFKFLML